MQSGNLKQTSICAGNTRRVWPRSGERFGRIFSIQLLTHVVCTVRLQLTHQARATVHTVGYGRCRTGVGETTSFARMTSRQTTTTTSETVAACLRPCSVRICAAGSKKAITLCTQPWMTQEQTQQPQYTQESGDEAESYMYASLLQERPLPVASIRVIHGDDQAIGTRHEVVRQQERPVEQDAAICKYSKAQSAQAVCEIRITSRSGVHCAHSRQQHSRVDCR